MVSFTSPSRASGQKNDRSNVRREEESEGQNCKISLVLKSALPSSDFISSFPNPSGLSIAVSTLAHHHSRTNIEGEHASIDEEKRDGVRFDVDVDHRASSKPLPHGFSSRAHLFPFQEKLGEKRRNPGRERERERKKNATSTPHLNGANGKAFDTDAFAVLTDFAKVGRAVATAAEDAWMANIVGFRVRVSGGDDDTIIGCVSEFFQKKKFNPKLFRV